MAPRCLSLRGRYDQNCWNRRNGEQDRDENRYDQMVIFPSMTDPAGAVVAPTKAFWVQGVVFRRGIA